MDTREQGEMKEETKEETKEEMKEEMKAVTTCSEGPVEPDQVVEHYPSGQLKSITRFINNKKSGVQTEYCKNGKLKSEKRYKDNLLHGIQYFYNKNGSSRLELNYQEGLKHGIQIRGKYQFMYKNGLKHGIQKGKQKQYFLQGIRCSKEVYEKLKDTDTVPPLPIPKKEIIIIDCVVTDSNGIETYVKKILKILRKFDSKRNLLKEIRFLGMTKDEYGCATVRNLHGKQIEFHSGKISKLKVYNNNIPCGEHYQFYYGNKIVEFYDEIFGMKLKQYVEGKYSYVFYKNKRHGICLDKDPVYYYLGNIYNQQEYNKLIFNKLVDNEDTVFFHANGIVKSIQNKNIFVKYDNTGQVIYLSYLQDGVPHGLTRNQKENLYYYQGHFCLSKEDFLNGKYINEKVENCIFQTRLLKTKIIVGVEIDENYIIPGITRFGPYYGYEIQNCNNIEGKIDTLRNIFNKEPNFYLI